MAFENNYHHESDADDEFERSSTILSPTMTSKGGYETSPTESEHYSPEHTPTTITHSTAHAVSPRGIITQWTTDSCAEFVSNLGLETYAEKFIEEEIDGMALIAIQASDLKDMGILSVGHRLTILKGVYEVKLKQNVEIEEDHYVPPSAAANAADAHATQDDILRITNQIKLRDERIMQAESDLRALREETESELKVLRDDIERILEEQKKLKEETLPTLRQVKDRLQPLPTPRESDFSALTSSTGNLNGSVSNLGLSSPSLSQPQDSRGNSFTVRKATPGFAPNVQKIPSPTLRENMNIESSPAALEASNHLTTSMSAGSQASPHFSSQPSPTTPPSSRLTHSITNERMSVNASRPRDTSSSTSRSSADNDPNGFIQAFRVSMDEPCYKVLPVALKKYNIHDDWRQYSLYIVHGDQERCLGLDEKPLILFKSLANEGKKPMFMLRKHAAPENGFSHSRSDVNTATNTAVNSSRTSSLHVSGTGGNSSSSRTSYATNANTMQLPGGVL